MGFWRRGVGQMHAAMLLTLRILWCLLSQRDVKYVRKILKSASCSSDIFLRPGTGLKRKVFWQMFGKQHVLMLVVRHFGYVILASV